MKNKLESFTDKVGLHQYGVGYNLFRNYILYTYLQSILHTIIIISMKNKNEKQAWNYEIAESDKMNKSSLNIH